MHKFLDKVEELTFVTSVAMLAIVSICNVIGRSLLSHSLEAGEELSVIFIIVITFLGIGYCARKDRHIKMSAILEYLPNKYSFVIARGINAITSVMFLALTYYAVDYVNVVSKLESRFPVLGFPVAYIYVVPVVGFFVAGIQYGILAVTGRKRTQEV